MNAIEGLFAYVLCGGILVSEEEGGGIDVMSFEDTEEEDEIFALIAVKHILFRPERGEVLARGHATNAAKEKHVCFPRLSFTKPLQL